MTSEQAVVRPSTLHHLKSLFPNGQMTKAELQRQNESILKEINDLQTQVTSLNPELSNSSHISSVLKLIQETKGQNDHVQKEIDKSMKSVDKMLKPIEAQLEEMERLERQRTYMQTLLIVKDLDTQIRTAFLVQDLEDLERCIHLFADIKNMAIQLMETECYHLLNFIKERHHSWFDILLKRVEKPFLEALETCGWPFTSASTGGRSSDALAQLHHWVDLLLQLEPPDAWRAELRSVHLLLPIQLMIIPLQRRFHFHFYGPKRTNDAAKPEWYMTKVLNWIRDHSHFVRNEVQPILKRNAISKDAEIEFCSGMITLVAEKLSLSLPALEEPLLAHTVCEAVSFVRALQTRFLLPAALSMPILEPLCQEETFLTWITAEKKNCSEKMDQFFSSATAWQTIYSELNHLDEMKAPEVAEQFLMLLQSMNERFKWIPAPSCKLRFLSLVEHLLDEFRLRTVQSMRNQDVHAPYINALHYVSHVIREWKELPFYLEMTYYSSEFLQFASSHVDAFPNAIHSSMDILDYSGPLLGMFDHSKATVVPDVDALGNQPLMEDTLRLYSHVVGETCETIGRDAFRKVVSQSNAFKQERWMAISSQRDLVGKDLTPSAIPMLQTLRDRLLEAKDALAQPLFASMWPKLAQQLDEFLFDEVILANHFNEHGGIQLKFDLTKNLFPLFGEFTAHPENYFKRSRDGCVLLASNNGTVQLVKDVLGKALHETKSRSDAIKTLREVGVSSLKVEDAEQVLARRVFVP